MTESDFFLLPMEQTPRLQFDYLFHNPNPAIDEYLHGDHVHTNEDGEEVVSPGTPDRPVVIEPEPEPDPDPPNANPGPAPAPEPEDDPRHLWSGDSGGTLVGGDNDDLLNGRAGHDVLIGGPGDDILQGYLGDDVIIGGPGDDTLRSQGGGRLILLDGGPGDDHLSGTARGGGSGGGGIVMIGGPGRDHFGIIFDSTVGSDRAKIMDFQDGADRIWIENSDNPPHSNRLTAFYNRVMEAGLTFDMAWIASEQGNDVVVELADDTITLVDTRLSELQLAVIDETGYPGLYIV